MPSKQLGLLPKSMLAASINFTADTIKAILAPSSYTPNYDTHQFKSSVTEISTVSTTLAAGATAGATTVSLTASIPIGTQIQIDTAGLAEVRTITNITGAGPYTATVAAITNTHSSGATVVASPGYTATGTTLTSCTVTYTAANSWGTSRANTTAYSAGVVVRPATGNGFLYQCSTAGTSGGSIPTYPTVVGQTVTDGTAVWTCMGTGISVLTGTLPAWTSASIIARYCIFLDQTPASDATRPLIAIADFGTDTTSSGGSFTVTIDPILGIAYFFTS